VAALRETSVLFAALLGTWFLIPDPRSCLDLDSEALRRLGYDVWMMRLNLHLIWLCIAALCFQVVVSTGLCKVSAGHSVDASLGALCHSGGEGSAGHDVHERKGTSNWIDAAGQEQSLASIQVFDDERTNGNPQADSHHCCVADLSMTRIPSMADYRQEAPRQALLSWHSFAQKPQHRPPIA
jgi:hypothetical protein